jgi:alkaline phosphatase D
MKLRLTRRQALAGLAAATVGSRTGAFEPGAGAAAEPFAHGVASGDPDHSSVVLWTRVAPLEPRMEVSWYVARDPAFEQPVTGGTVVTGGERDHTVKVVADGLTPGETYYYRFGAAGAVSPVGRTRTLPAGALARLGLAIASCSNYPFGHFNAYDAIARDPQIDFVLHLGDYLYEYGADGWGGAVGAGIGRVHRPATETVTLADYRERHAQYKTDAGSRAMLAAHPLLCIWDDHESTNNPWMGGAENHQPEAEGPWAARRAASLQAYFEWMPVRDPGPDGSRARYWRHYAFGDLASLVTLETRHTGRSRQVEYREHLLGIRSREDAERFLAERVGDPERTMLSADMERFLAQALTDSKRTDRPWRLIGNPIPMARVHVPPLDGETFDAVSSDPEDPVAGQLRHLTTLGRYDLPLYLDPWDGYPAARERFYRLCAAAGARDLLVLTGDSHAFWTNALFDDGGGPMGLELGTAGITSPGDFEGFGRAGGARLDALIAAHNPEVLWTDNLHRGFVRLLLGRDEAAADFVTVTRVDVPEYRAERLRRVRIVRDGERLRYA